MGVTVAAILYLVFFGTYDFNGNSLVGTKTGNIQQTSEWEGVLWYMTEYLETPIARYYYEYCYLPNVHANDYVSEALGMYKNEDYYNNNIQKTASDLSVSTDASNDFYYGATYSTGWK